MSLIKEENEIVEDLAIIPIRSLTGGLAGLAYGKCFLNKENMREER